MAYTDELGNIWTNPEDIARFGGPVAPEVFFTPGYGAAGVGTRPVETIPQEAAAPILSDKYVYSSAGTAALPQLDSFYSASEPGPSIAIGGDLGLGSSFEGTDFNKFLSPVGVAMDDFMSVGGVDFPSLRGILEDTLALVPQFFDPGSGLPPSAYQRKAAPKVPLLGGACPPGRRPQVRTTHVVSGRNICAKKPHMNVTNRHALARSTRRVSGFLHLAKNTEKKMRQAFGGLLTHHKTARGGRCVGCGQTRSRCAC
jgi:hypothetical protein